MDDHQACRTESLSAPELSRVARSDAASSPWVCLFARLVFRRSLIFQLVILSRIFLPVFPQVLQRAYLPACEN